MDWGEDCGGDGLLVLNIGENVLYLYSASLRTWLITASLVNIEVLLCQL